MLLSPVGRPFAVPSLAAALYLSMLCSVTGQPTDSPQGPEAARSLQPEPQPADDAADTATPPPRSPYRSPIVRLASVPNMFGDFFNQGGQLRAVGGGTPALMDTPLAGGSRRVKIAENNKPLPMDRYYFMYNHFHNALEAKPNLNVPGLLRRTSVERYTIGLERMFLDGLWSAEIRMPFTDSYGMSVPKFTVSGREIGNLALSLKRLLAAGPTGSLVVGLGIDVPTGSNVTGRVVSANYTMHNQAVHLSPYVGLLTLPNDRVFYQGFLQVDVAANGNRIDYTSTFPVTSGTFGKLTEQTLLHVDFSAGCWLYRNPRAPMLTGLASLLEFHYTTTLEDAQVLSGTVGPSSFQFGNLLNQIDVVHLTVGLHGELAGNTTLRVGAVFPLQNSLDNPFDAEVQVSVNRRF